MAAGDPGSAALGTPGHGAPPTAPEAAGAVEAREGPSEPTPEPQGEPADRTPRRGARSAICPSRGSWRAPTAPGEGPAGLPQGAPQGQ
eukprot:3343456-Alexandrium_andersonii.AAC.1